MRTQRWKLVRTWGSTGKHADPWELYALQNDGLELENLLVFDKPFPAVSPKLSHGLDALEVSRGS